MIYKNTASQGLYVFAYDKTTGAGKTGDAANITAAWSKDGAASAATNDVNPAEIGGGVYWFDLSQAEVNCNAFALVPVSGTANVVLDAMLGQTEHGGIAGVAASVWANGIRTLTAMSFTVPATLDAAERNAIADALLKRDWTAVSGEAARSALNALRAIRNKVSRGGAVLTICKEDDSTAAWTAAIATSAAAEPVTSVDPA